MNCPVCSSHLKLIKFKNTEVGKCLSCGGVWFDAGELKNFMNGVFRIPPDIELPPESPEANLNRKCYCPRCLWRLEKGELPFTEGVPADMCPKCSGIWLRIHAVNRITRYSRGVRPYVSLGAALLAYRIIFEHLIRFCRVLSQPAFCGIRFNPLMIVPLSDDQPRIRAPLISLWLILISAVVFLFQFFLSGNSRAFYELFSFNSMRPFSFGIITSIFLHQGFSHLAGNMFYLHLFGDNVEDRLGRLRYLIFYLVCGVVAHLIFLGFYPQKNFTSVGASGAVAGIMGAYFVFYRSAKVKFFFLFRVINVPAIIVLLGWFLLQLLSQHTDGAMKERVAWMAHIGGFAFGGIFAALILFLEKRCQPRLEEIQVIPPVSRIQTLEVAANQTNE